MCPDVFGRHDLRSHTVTRAVPPVELSKQFDQPFDSEIRIAHDLLPGAFGEFVVEGNCEWRFLAAC